MISEVEAPLLELDPGSFGCFCWCELLEDLPVPSQDGIYVSYINTVDAVDLVVVAGPAEIGAELLIHPSPEGVSAFKT